MAPSDHIFCLNCERYKASAATWRNRAYELNGTPLPWKPDELWVGLTDEEYQEILEKTNSYGLLAFYNEVEKKLKEKNG